MASANEDYLKRILQTVIDIISELESLIALSAFSQVKEKDFRGSVSIPPTGISSSCFLYLPSSYFLRLNADVYGSHRGKGIAIAFYLYSSFPLQVDLRRVIR